MATASTATPNSPHNTARCRLPPGVSSAVPGPPPEMAGGTTIVAPPMRWVCCSIPGGGAETGVPDRARSMSARISAAFW